MTHSDQPGAKSSVHEEPHKTKPEGSVCEWPSSSALALSTMLGLEGSKFSKAVESEAGAMLGESHSLTPGKNKGTLAREDSRKEEAATSDGERGFLATDAGRGDRFHHSISEAAKAHKFGFAVSQGAIELSRQSGSYPPEQRETILAIDRTFSGETALVAGGLKPLLHENERETFSLSKRAKVVSFVDGESRLIQGLAQAGFDGQGAIGLVRGESERANTYASAGRSIPAYTQDANIHDIIAEEGRLIERAKAEDFFWEADKVAKVIAAAKKKGGGSEHDVYIIGEPPHKIAIRSTIQDSYGFRFRSPAQYLKRLEDYNKAFPGIQTRMIGVSKNSRGNGVIWTAQTFVEGKAFSKESDVQKALEKQGWQRQRADTTYKHEATGIVIRDAHSDNVLQHGKELFPIDVIVTDTGSNESFSLSPVRRMELVENRLAVVLQKSEFKEGAA